MQRFLTWSISVHILKLTTSFQREQGFCLQKVARKRPAVTHPVKEAISYCVIHTDKISGACLNLSTCFYGMLWCGIYSLVRN